MIEAVSATAVPQPPRIHWAVVLLSDALTGGLFGAIWMILQANWVRKIRGSNVIVWLAIANAAATAVEAAAEFAHWMKWTAFSFNNYWDGLVLALWLASVYTMRQELRSEPIGLPLGRFMPYLFGPVYFQYHLMDYGANSARVGSAGQPMGP